MPDELIRTFFIWSDQFETWVLAGNINSALESIKHDFLEDAENNTEEIEILIKRHDMTKTELAALPET